MSAKDTTYLADVVPRLRDKLPTRYQVKKFGYDHAFKLILLSVMFCITMVASIIVNLL